ncbi:MAG: murein transglycosylase [Proteobacteria bacterium]|nr:MAG: murein transglycosylase [Pseudomonadota bacterium]
MNSIPAYEPGSALAASSAFAPALPVEPPVSLKKLSSLENSKMQFSPSNETPFIFDIPVTYNERVSNWIHYFQTSGRRSFRTWLERSARFLPVVEAELSRAGLPQDLVYVAMIESGFRPDAVSHAGAMGMWQFISATGKRYGLNIDWWVDERRDFAKSTQAAIAYMKDLNSQFNSWYLVAASYNMGENGVRKLMKRHNTNDFWTLADRKALPRETTDYVPKIIAATLIAKAPALYGFRDLEYQAPLSFEMFRVPGGTDLMNLAAFLGVSGKYIQELNPELLRGFVPREVKGHNIRIPKGSGLVVSQFVRLQQAAPIRESAQNDLQ